MTVGSGKKPLLAALRPAPLGSKAPCSPESWFLIVKLMCVHVQNWEIQKPMKRKDHPTLRTWLRWEAPGTAEPSPPL